MHNCWLQELENRKKELEQAIILKNKQLKVLMTQMNELVWNANIVLSYMQP